MALVTDTHTKTENALYEGHGFSRAKLSFGHRGLLQAAEKLASLKGMAFRPYITAVFSRSLFSP
jgi:hypothetical protein